MIRDALGIVSCLYLLSQMIVPANSSWWAAIFDGLVRLTMLLFIGSLGNAIITP